MSTAARLAACLSLSTAATAAVAAPMPAPITFTTGTPAKASEVNQNFSAAKAAVDSHDTRLTSLESPNNSLPMVTTTQNLQPVGTVVPAAGRSWYLLRFSLPAMASYTRVFIDIPISGTYNINTTGLSFALYKSVRNGALGGYHTTISGLDVVCLEDEGYQVVHTGTPDLTGTYHQALECSSHLDSITPVFFSFDISFPASSGGASTGSDFSGMDPYSAIPTSAQRTQNFSELKSLLQYVNFSFGH